MPRRKHSSHIPQMQLHKPSGRARVRLNGHDVWLGKHGTPAAEATYRRVIAEWLQSGVVPRKTAGIKADSVEVDLLAVRYAEFCKKAMRPRTFETTVKPPVRRFRRFFSGTQTGDLTIPNFKSFRQHLVDERDDAGRRLSLNYINKTMGRARTLLRWGVSEGLVPVDVLHRIEAIPPLRASTTDAPRHVPVKPVSDEVLERTLVHLPPMLADLARVIRLTGCRPGEACQLRWADVDKSSDVWIYTPRSHKTESHGRERHIAIGPKAQAVLLKYLDRPAEEVVFSPKESERLRLRRLAEARQTKVQPSQVERAAKRARNPKRKFREAFTTDVLGRRIAEVCERHDIPHWSPNQLRHSAATAIRARFGLDAAGATLGHSKIETTQLYAERDRELAARVAREVG